MKHGDLICICYDTKVFSVTTRRTISVSCNDVCIFLRKLDYTIGTHYHVFHIRTRNIIEASSIKIKEL
jgi:hypothetical protein